MQLLPYIISIVVLFIGVHSPLHPQDKPSLAIIDFEGFGVSEQESSVLTNRLGTYMVRSGAYRVIERGQMRQILDEQDFQLTGCTSDECAVEIGQMLGAQLILAGSFGKIGTTYTIDMRIIDVQTGGILETASHDVRGDIELVLTEGLAEAANRLTGLWGADLVPESAPVVAPATPAPASLDVYSQPMGAAVTIDNQSAGRTPLRGHAVQPGMSHRLAMELEGYSPVDTTLYAEAGQQIRVNLPLVRLRGWLAIQGDNGATIRINGNLLGQLPLNRQQLPVGAHELKATKPEYFPYSTTVQLLSDREAVVQFQLQQKPKQPAIVFSTLVPGGGQLYQGYISKGLVFLAGAAAAAYLTYSNYAAFTDEKDAYESMHTQYLAATDAAEIVRLREEMQIQFDAMEKAKQSLYLIGGILGGIWIVNIVEVSL